MAVAEFELLIARKRLRPNQARQVFTGAIPIVILGVLACSCVLENAVWRKGADSLATTKLWGTAEESKQNQAITIAEHIDKDAVNQATPPPIDPEIMKEVEKAEAEQATESAAEAAFAAGKEPEPPAKAGAAKDGTAAGGDAGGESGAAPDGAADAAAAAPVEPASPVTAGSK